MHNLVTKTVGPLTIQAYSLAGEETVIAIPTHNVCFDPGRAPREIMPIDNMCITHGHMDHCAGIAYYLSQRAFLGHSPGRVIVHRGLAQPIQALMGVWAEIEGHHTACDIIGVQALEEVAVRRDLFIRPFEVNHGQFAMGFALIEVRHKLKLEFNGLTGTEIVALKRKGVSIQENREVTLAACSGDTAVGGWLERPFVRQAEVLFVECTFFEPDHVSRARAGRHIHVRDLPTVLEAVPDAVVLLTHVSRRTDLRQAKATLQRIISPRDHSRVSFLMERPPRNDRRPMNQILSQNEPIGPERT